MVSTGEVYGAGVDRPRREADPLLPCSPYAASKVGAEVAALEAWRRTGLRVVIARPFAHTGPGQSDRFVAPAFAARLRAARRAGASTVSDGQPRAGAGLPRTSGTWRRRTWPCWRAACPARSYNVAQRRGHFARRPVPPPGPSHRRGRRAGAGSRPAAARRYLSPGGRPDQAPGRHRLAAAALPFDRTLKELADAEAD